MKIKEKIQSDLKEAMKTGNTVERDALRLLSGMIKNAEIKKGKNSGEISDNEAIRIVSQAVKQRRESVRQYKEGGRNDLAEKEERELEIISKYLPRQLSADEIKEIVDKVVVQMKAQSESDMGKVMGAVMKQAAGKADGNLVREIVEETLRTSK